MIKVAFHVLILVACLAKTSGFSSAGIPSVKYVRERSSTFGVALSRNRKAASVSSLVPGKQQTCISSPVVFNPPLQASSVTISEDSIPDVPSANSSNKPSFPVVLWRFTRPHTIIGSALAIPAIHMLAAPNFSSVITVRTVYSILYAMVPSLLMNLYITGLNQITDVEIDKINKPNLPIAKGDLSKETAKIVVTVSLLASLFMGVASPAYGSNGLNIALWGSAILGTMYSLPPFRLKRFPFLAAFCIVAVRGTIINAGFYAHAMSAAFGYPATTVWTALQSDPKCFLSSLFFGIFGLVIALMKDVPDVKGDSMANIRSFSVRAGQKTVFHSMRRLLSLLFYAFSAGFVRWSVMAVAQGESLLALCRAGVAVFSAYFGVRARQEGKKVDAEDSKKVYNYYMYLWKLFYASYLALPFVK